MFNHSDPLNMQGKKKYLRWNTTVNTRLLCDLDLSNIYSITPEQQHVATIYPSKQNKRKQKYFSTSNNPDSLSKYTVCTSEELNPELTVTQLSLGVRAHGLEGLCQRYPLGGLLRGALAVQRW